jgi:predicted esterase
VARTARYHVAGDPAAAEEIWFVLHGYGQLAARFLSGFGSLRGAGQRRAVVAPEALSRFYVEGEIGPHGRDSRVGASWMTREDREREIEDYVDYLDRVAAEVLGLAAPGAPPRVVVLGFSQGSETASRWVTYGAVDPAELILWGGGLAADLDLARLGTALAAVRLRLVIGSEDRWGGGRAEESEARLRLAGVESERVDYVGGHRLEEEVLARL